MSEYERGIRDGIEMAAAYLKSQSGKSSVWEYEVRMLARKIPEREDNAISE